MRIVCIQHVDFETPGIIQEWAQDKGFAFQILKPYQGDTFPNSDEFDGLISMGGPQSPRDAIQLPYLQQEIDFIRETVAAKKHTLGFCLGAQLIGEALGGRTGRSPEKEVGVYPIMLTEDGKRDPLFQGLPASFPVIHWHNDMPGFTEGAILLASSEGCPVQAYRYGPRVYGLQFHMEITKKGIEDLISNVPDDLKSSRFTQSKDELLSQDYGSINLMMLHLLERFVAL